MKVNSFNGPVTQDELQSFSSYVATLQPATNNIGNQWAQGHSGEETKAMGLVYSISGQQDVLDNMLRYCDAVLSQRNDLAKAPNGQYRIWTGDIAPVWPKNVDTKPISTGGEQGDPVGHLASCAHLILKNTKLYGKTVAIGDKYGYGKTYLERAKTYVKQADKAMTGHILSRLLDVSRGNKMYFAKDSPYKGGTPVPWNQQMMFTYAFQNLVAAHALLGDNSDLTSKYRAIMAANLDWFFNGGGAEAKKSKKGSTVYDWDYAFGQGVEDVNHGSLDVAGFHRAYTDGSWNVTTTQMTTLANTFVDVMRLGGGKYAGTVEGGCGDGHASCINYVRSGFLLMAQFRPDAYRDMMVADLKEGGTTTKTDVFSRFLWVKNARSESSKLG
ncbi:hypothetical protein ISF_01140 [Cordyceps fumosorosea ARSEF 2679]|uniref:Uncharacterized protein n=1 Tax=Cordyceps fumosorosea (strain ARSEF 2679) TaxID=1081104 RepID=A0A162N220_CORFA|nr:hypothetical protein ISF_01140 [Cordyceps fumosorosea ARSEF 2679]OAA74239.1 hypothetical protein ISF_01140 [Cordyceps fumosorosea ARSEF 2679]